MTPFEFRKNLRNYHKDRERLRRCAFFGVGSYRSEDEINEIYSDLFTLSTVRSLEKTLANSSDQNETERKGRRNLIRIARLGHLESKSAEVNQELTSCLASIRVAEDGEELDSVGVFARIRTLETTEKRNSLFDRWTEAAGSSAELFLEKVKRSTEISQELGFASIPALFADTAGQDFTALVQKVERFLDRTENAYFDLLSRVSDQFRLTGAAGTMADQMYLAEQFERKDLYIGQDLSFLYLRLLENFGFTPGKIPQIKFKRVSGANQLFCEIPGKKIFLCGSVRSGAKGYFQFLYNFGRAQKNAWTSTHLLKENPEFVFAPDQVLEKAYGFLFRSLMADQFFMERHLRIRDEKLRKAILAENKFRILLDSRRAAVQFILEQQLFAAKTEDTAAVFRAAATDFQNNLGFSTRSEHLFLEISSEFTGQKNLRAIAFAYGLREYLRERYDFGWWNERRAFEELIEIWNTAGRYRAEELASLVGFEMSFDLLAEGLT